MDPHRVAPALLVLCLPFLGGCRPRVEREESPHVGAKVNIAHFIRNTAAYRGKAIMLALKVGEPIASSQGQSLRSYVGRDVKFTSLGPRGERLEVTIRIPEGLSVPEVGNSDEVFVTFVCTQGSLGQGNEARAFHTREKPRPASRNRP
jgi:hypothetical protein